MEKKYEKIGFFLQKPTQDAPTTPSVEKPALNGSICSQEYRFLQGGHHLVNPGFAGTGG